MTRSRRLQGLWGRGMTFTLSLALPNAARPDEQVVDPVVHSPADLEPLVRPVLVVGVDIRLQRLMQGEKLVWCESQIRHVYPCA